MSVRQFAQKFRWLDWALDQRTGNPTSNLLLIHMARVGNSSGECWKSEAKLAEDVGVSVRSIQRAKKHLLTAGYLVEVLGRQRRSTKRYRFARVPVPVPVSKSRQKRQARHDSNDNHTRQIGGENLKNQKSESGSAFPLYADQYDLVRRGQVGPAGRFGNNVLSNLARALSEPAV